MKKKTIIITLIICFIILFGTTILSKMYFNIWNPFSSSVGLIKILFTDEEYAVIQKNPKKVMISKRKNKSEKPETSYLNDYMKKRGFVLEDQLGAILIYSDGIDQEYVHFSINRFYVKWSWE